MSHSVCQGVQLNTVVVAVVVTSACAPLFSVPPSPLDALFPCKAFEHTLFEVAHETNQTTVVVQTQHTVFVVRTYVGSVLGERLQHT